jgi:hypothetical protein
MHAQLLSAARWLAGLASLYLAGLACSRTTQGQDAENRSEQADRAVLTEIVRLALPEEYENRKRWGMTKDITRGWSLEREGGRLHWKERTKKVNHGTWTQYRIRLLDPGDLDVQLLNARRGPNGEARFDLVAEASVEVFGRLAEWLYGVQLYSLNAQAEALVRLTAVCDITLILDPVHVPPDFVVKPHIADAQLELVRFELVRFSQLQGPAARVLGDGLQDVLDEVLQDKRQKLVDKLNQQIARKQDRLRLSLHDSASELWQQVRDRMHPTATADEP